MLQLRAMQRMAGRAASGLPLCMPLPSVALCAPLPAAAAAALTVRRFGSANSGCAIGSLQRAAGAVTIVAARHFSSGSSGDSGSSSSGDSPAMSGGGDSADALQSQRRLTSQLVQLAKQGDSATAERLVAEAEAAGLQPDVRAVTAWLGCYMVPGGWRGAEAAWQRMARHKLVPDSVSYRSLMQVYMADGSSYQLAKITPLYAEMRRGSGPVGRPLHFSVRDYENLIKTAHRYRLASEARRWAKHATTTGVLSLLDGACRKILSNVSEWGRQPQLTIKQRALSALLPELPAADALAAVEQTGAKSGASDPGVDVKIATAWLSGYVRNGDCRSAEKVWQRLAGLRIAPDSVAYRTRMQVCMANGSAEQLATIEQLYKEMGSTTGPARTPLQLSAGDYAQLIETAHRWRLDDQVLKWSERAKAAGLWSKLGGRCRKIFALVSGEEPQAQVQAQAQTEENKAPEAKPAAAAKSATKSRRYGFAHRRRRKAMASPQPDSTDTKIVEV